mmetsp:Transcript_21337/g.29899  ORF Transcript_21337/g.29899 Transcript_21337/m.29899 type:complete len:154 (+) Transcript_21337:190-651(+)
MNLSPSLAYFCNVEFQYTQELTSSGAGITKEIGLLRFDTDSLFVEPASRMSMEYIPADVFPGNVGSVEKVVTKSTLEVLKFRDEERFTAAPVERLWRPLAKPLELKRLDVIVRFPEPTSLGRSPGRAAESSADPILADALPAAVAVCNWSVEF